MCVHIEFEGQARHRPNVIAVALGDETLTYGGLNARANALAYRLIAKGAGPECLIGLCTDRTPGLIVGMIGILKAGAAYVPFDPALPSARLDYMIGDTGMRLLVTTRDLAAWFSDFSGDVLYLDDERAIADPAPRAGPENLAYVIYTSGSTGRPKGVMIEHRNLMALFRAAEPYFSFSERDVWALFHSAGFDLSVWEIWGALLYGGRIEIVPRNVARSAPDFRRFLAERRITVLDQTPSAFISLLGVPEMDNRHGDLALRLVTLAGEALIPPKLKPWWDAYRGRRPEIVNMYGITEITIHATYHRVNDRDLASPQSVIGRPLPHLDICINEPDGEIHVAGAGVARGYLNRPDLTRERFQRGPDGAPIYRSGDLGLRCADGALVYLGRRDQQVKIRGYRIELGEIEAALCARPDVAECAVVAHTDTNGSKRLVAYVVPTPGRAVAPATLRRDLAAALPDYMVPAAIVTLKSLPLTPNGKIDRKALPEPGDTLSRPYVAPRTKTEKAVAAIWAQVLKQEMIGADDDFFDLGGDSLLAAEMALRTAKDLGVEVSLAQLFENPVLKDFAVALPQPSP